MVAPRSQHCKEPAGFRESRCQGAQILLRGKLEMEMNVWVSERSRWKVKSGKGLECRLRFL